jgi:hypothetical protein
LQLTGDIANSTTISIFASETVETVTWNGDNLSVKSADGGILKASLESTANFSLPSLSGWSYADSLPEIQSDYAATGVAWVGMSNWADNNEPP